MGSEKPLPSSGFGGKRTGSEAEVNLSRPRLLPPATPVVPEAGPGIAQCRSGRRPLCRTVGSVLGWLALVLAVPPLENEPSHQVQHLSASTVHGTSASRCSGMLRASREPDTGKKKKHVPLDVQVTVTLCYCLCLPKQEELLFPFTV